MSYANSQSMRKIRISEYSEYAKFTYGRADVLREYTKNTNMRSLLVCGTRVCAIRGVFDWREYPDLYIQKILIQLTQTYASLTNLLKPV